MFFRTIRKYDLMSLSMTSQSLCSRAVNFLDTGTGWQRTKNIYISELQQELYDVCTCKFTIPTTSSRLTAWLFSGLEGKGGCTAAISSPFFNMPLQVPVPPSVCSPTGPPAVVYRGDTDSERQCHWSRGKFLGHDKKPTKKDSSKNLSRKWQILIQGDRNCPMKHNWEKAD